MNIEKHSVLTDEIPKNYTPQEAEPKIYQQWLDQGYFNPDKLPKPEDGFKGNFSLMLPPPNVTGTLHLGHAFEGTIQDIFARYKRMSGFQTLWLPGTDHAAIATQNKVEKILEKEQGKKKTDFSREEFLEKVNSFALQSQTTILDQLKQMGFSLDWSRQAYTLDEKRNLAVRTAFVNMYNDGLIYRGYKVVNWDPKTQTVISDDEVEHTEREAVLYTFKYSHDFPIAIATTRPETKFGDSAVAVNPSDERYKQYVGQAFEVNFLGTNLEIKVIADESVDPDFGTGALGVTPAHSMADHELAQKHDLKIIPVINEYAKMTAGHETLIGKKTSEAREITAQLLDQAGLIIKQEKISQSVSISERSGAVVEPLPKLQWFIDVNKKFVLPNSQLAGIKSGSQVSLKEIMATVVESGQIKITPERFSKIYFNWINNLRDWCISRQLWFGHQIPAWYKDDKIYVGLKAPQEAGWSQDEDTLDTWFSSGLWTFSTLGWPNLESKDFQNFHPTTMIIPGYEILFFWVARMILMSGYNLGQIPFKNVYLHGIVRDKQGRKFSKSLNNGIDPRDMIAKYGTDALRMALVFNSGAGNDVMFDEQKVKGMKHFANKVWNIARFYMIQRSALPDEGIFYKNVSSLLDADPNTFKNLSDNDRDIIARLNEVINTATTHIDEFRIHEAAQLIYDFVWKEFADVYVERAKKQIESGSDYQTIAVLNVVLNKSLKLLHPFMPFVTEHIWQQVEHPRANYPLIASKWPTTIGS